MAYCIYTDRDVPDSEGNLDHIIPLSLGGSNQFVTWSEEAYNSHVGSSVDGAIIKDPFISFALRNADVRGHSNKRREPVWKNSQVEGRPAQVTWGAERIIVWDARDRRELDEEEVAEKVISTQLRLDPYAVKRFLAKVALGGGYFLYGDAFRRGAECDILRELILFDRKTANPETYKNSRILLCDRYHPDSQAGGPAHMYRFLCENLHRSLFIAETYDQAISLHLGIVGEYIGSITIPMDTSALPRDGDYDLGHVIILSPGETQRISFRELLARCHEAINGEKLHDSPRPFGEAELPSEPPSS